MVVMLLQNRGSPGSAACTSRSTRLLRDGGSGSAPRPPGAPITKGEPAGWFSTRLDFFQTLGYQNGATEKLSGF